MHVAISGAAGVMLLQIWTWR